jgi:hypothetical protein
MADVDDTEDRDDRDDTDGPDGADGPDDGVLLEVLDLRRVDAWRSLTELDEEFRARPHADDDCVWGERYSEYGARIESARRLLTEVGAVTPAYPWMRCRPPALGADGRMGAADAVRLATRVVRSERFGDGNIADAVHGGVLQAVVAALVAWYREAGRAA